MDNAEQAGISVHRQVLVFTGMTVTTCASAVDRTRMFKIGPKFLFTLQ